MKQRQEKSRVFPKRAKTGHLILKKDISINKIFLHKEKISKGQTFRRKVKGKGGGRFFYKIGRGGRAGKSNFAKALGGKLALFRSRGSSP